MSFEIYVQCFKGGEPSGLARELVRNAFGEFLTEPDTALWHLHYDDENSCDVSVSPLEDDDKLVHHLCIEGPCGDKRLWNSLAAILRLGSVVLYFPGGPAPLITSEATTVHLPPDMLEALGQPLCVQTGDEIVRQIEAA